MLQSILQFFKLILIYPFFYLSLIIQKSYKPTFDKIFFVLFISLFVKYIDIFSYDEFLVGFIISSAVYVGSDFYLQSTFVYPVQYFLVTFCPHQVYHLLVLPQTVEMTMGVNQSGRNGFTLGIYNI